MATSRECATCGRAWPADSAGALQGGCPYCLLAFALGDDEPIEPEQPADTIARHLGPYAILATLGQGGMGVVYRARHETLGRAVALKVLDPSFAARAEFPLRFQREAQVLAALAHPHIVGIHDVGCEAGQYFLAMEFIDGQTLRQLLHGGRPPWQRAVEIATQLAAALAHAHARGVVHRDLKPENILIDTAGDVRLGDFGIAKLMSDDADGSRLTRTQVILGTRCYMAPEQLEPGRSIDHRADLYGLGVVLYEMLTGELPLGIFPPPSRTPGVPTALDAVLRKCLEKEPRLRYQQAAELTADLNRVGFRPQPSRRGLVVAGAALIGISLVGALMRRGNPTDPPPEPEPVELLPPPKVDVLSGHGGRVWTAAWFHQTPTLATASEDRSLRFWNTSTGQLLGTRPAFPRGDIGPVMVTIAADDATLATAGGEGIIRLWSPTAEKEIASWSAHGREITALRFAPTGNTLASASHDRSVKLWDAGNRKLLHTLTGHTDPVLSVAFSANGRQVAAGAMNGGVRIWDTSTGKETADCGHARRVWAVAFAPDTGWLYTGSHEASVKVWDLALPGKQRLQTTLVTQAEVWSLAIAPAGRILAAGCQDGVIRAWDLRSGQPLPSWTGHGAAVVALAFSPDGKRLASASWDQTARLWSVPSDDG